MVGQDAGFIFYYEKSIWIKLEIQTDYSSIQFSFVLPQQHSEGDAHFFLFPNTKTIGTEVQNALRSKYSVVPYSNVILETILLDSVILCNAHIFFIE